MAIVNDPKDITRQDVLDVWKRIDRALKRSTSDSEISGEPNRALVVPDLLPLELPDNRTLLGAYNANELSRVMDQWEKEQLDKKRRYEKLRTAQEHPEVDGALSIYADEATTEDENGEIIHVSHPNEEIKNVIEDLFERIGIEEKAWPIIRNFCGYGDEYFEIVISRTGRSILKLSRLPREAVERIEENNILKGFRLNQEELESSDKFYQYKINYHTTIEEDEELMYPFRVVHFRIKSDKYGVYGQAVIDSIVSTIEQLKMMEKALIVARVTRAPERRVFTIDVGNLSGEKAIKYANLVVQNFKNKRRLATLSTDDTKTDLQRDIFGAVEDMVIPKRAGSEGNLVNTLEQANNLGDIADIEFLRDKIFPALGIPRQYFYDDTFANANTNLSSKSVPFAKKIKRVQRFFLNQLYKVCIIELKLWGYSNEEMSKLVLSMNNPSNIDDRERISVETERWGLISTIKALNAEKTFYPDFLIFKDILKLDEDEIVALLRFNQLQDQGINPFEAFELEERPEGAEELQTAPVGGESAGAGAPMGGLGGAPMGGGEIGPEEVGGEIPPEVEAELGPAPEGEGGEEAVPAPEEAEMADHVIDMAGKKPIMENKKEKIKERKFDLLKKLDYLLENNNALIHKEAEEDEKYNKSMRRAKRVAFSEMFLNGELDGLNTVHDITIYEEENKNEYLPYHND